MREHGAGGLWWAAVARAQWPDGEDFEDHLRKNWRKPWGDRRQELVFIGVKMNQEDLSRRLEECLLTEFEMSEGESVWKGYPDPFPVWQAIEEEPEGA